MKRIILLLCLVATILFAGMPNRFGNTDLSGNYTFQDSTTFSGDVVVKYVNNIVYADQYVSLQAAVNACPSTGGCVFLSPDTYYVAVACTLKDNVSIIGVGAASVIFNVSNGPAIIYSSTVMSQGKEKNYLANFMIRGTDSSGTAIFLRYVDNPRIENIWVRNNKGRGIHIAQCAEVTIIGCHLDSLWSSAIVMDTVHDVSIVGNVIDRVDSCGIWLNAPYDITITGNKIEYTSHFSTVSGGYGSSIRADGLAGHFNSIVITGNKLYSATETSNAGVYCSMASQNDTLGLIPVISGNVIDGSQVGVYLKNLRVANVSGNIFSELSRSAVYLDASDHILVTGNYISNTKGYAAFTTTSGADSNIFIGNSMRNVSAMVTDGGINNFFQNNILGGTTQTIAINIYPLTAGSEWLSGTKNTLSAARTQGMYGCQSDSLRVDSIFVLGYATEDSNVVDSMNVTAKFARSTTSTTLVANATDWGGSGVAYYTYTYSCNAIIPSNALLTMRFKPNKESNANKMMIMSMTLYGRPK